MALKQPTPLAVKNALLKLISKGPTTWQEIVYALTPKYDITNWLTQVRGPLQALMNAGLVRRTNNVFEEIYVGKGL